LVTAGDIFAGFIKSLHTYWIEFRKCTLMALSSNRGTRQKQFINGAFPWTEED